MTFTTNYWDNIDALYVSMYQLIWKNNRFHFIFSITQYHLIMTYKRH